MQCLWLPKALQSTLFPAPLSSTISLCLVLSKYPLPTPLHPDNECRNSPSYVFSCAWRLVSAHGPLIINLTLCAGRLIIRTYLYDSDLTSSPGDSVFSPFSSFYSSEPTAAAAIRERKKHTTTISNRNY